MSSFSLIDLQHSYICRTMRHTFKKTLNNLRRDDEKDVLGKRETELGLANTT